MDASVNEERRWNAPKDDAPQVVQGKRAKQVEEEVRQLSYYLVKFI